MIMNFDEPKVLQMFTSWGLNEPHVHAILITSTRAVPGAPVDEYSDYDIVLVVDDVVLFHQDQDWMQAFGTVLSYYRDPIMDKSGHLWSGYVVQFQSGLKADFTLLSPGMVPLIPEVRVLADEFDAGYVVLLDKTTLTSLLAAPTYRAYLPQPPTEAEVHTLTRNFFLDAAYVARYLWRRDQIASRYILDAMMKHENLIPMLIWHLEIEHQWQARPGPHGRRIQLYLRPDLLTMLEKTYAALDENANWQVLFNTLELFRITAKEVAQALSFRYLEEVDQQMTAYIQAIFEKPPRQ